MIMKMEPAGRESPKGCLGVIMPVFNEEGTVEAALRRVLAQRCVLEVVVVDDGSTDETSARVDGVIRRDGRARLLTHPINRGKGAAIRSALRHVHAPVVIIQDGDLEYDPDDYARLLGPVCRGEAEVVYGTRFGRGVMPVGWHSLGNRVLTCFTNLLTGLALTDEATGYKLFKREVLERMDLKEEGFGFCPEVTAKLARMGLAPVEVPIRYEPRTRAQGKKIRLRDGLRALWCLIKYSHGGSRVAVHRKPAAG
jgi:glycosyltransferase involved in cell wall biosynthesis